MSPPPTGHKQSSLNGYSRRKRNFSPTQQNESLSPPVDPAISPDHAGNSTAESGSSRLTGGEDNLTLRRREANRLAAQRFRSRKKGYQDSLEERIRVLEEEKDIMARSMGQPLRQEYYPPPRSASPEKGPIDVDVRVAALESANRRLQDELRVIAEDNDRLRDEVDRWRQWERESRQAPTLAPLDFGQAPLYPAHPSLERGHSYSYHPPSPGPRLPPLRLPPLQTPQSSARSPVGSPESRPKDPEVDR